jgi:hypothetical protein
VQRGRGWVLRVLLVLLLLVVVDGLLGELLGVGWLLGRKGAPWGAPSLVGSLMGSLVVASFSDPANRQNPKPASHQPAGRTSPAAGVNEQNLTSIFDFTPGRYGLGLGF